MRKGPGACRPRPGALPAARRGTRRGAQRLILAGSALILALLGLAALTLAFGRPSLSPAELLEALRSDQASRAADVVRELRAPRLVLALAVGAMFGLSGVIMQDALRNPLAGPELLAVTPGASLAVAVVVVFQVPVATAAQPFVALGAGALCGAFVLAFTRLGADPVRVLLTGAVLAVLLNALIMAVIVIGPPRGFAAVRLYRFLTGSLSGVAWSDVLVVVPWLAIGGAVMALGGRVLNLLRLGDDVAQGLGIRVARARGMLFVAASALVAPGVAVAGPIAFVALLAPHVTRLLLRTSDARQVLPVAALAGAVMLVAADLFGRLAFQPLELPAGLWTIVFGGPCLLLLLLRGVEPRRA